MSHKVYVRAITLLLIAGIAGVCLWYISTQKNGEVLGGGDGEVACTMEAKMCPDGSYVGRTGPSCAFAECPSSVAATTTVALNQTITQDSIRITPQKVTSDSRCPNDVVCIWEGEVRVSVLLDAEGEQKTVEMTLGKSVQFAGRTIVLSGVSPQTNSKTQIANEDYRFTFKVTPLR